MIPSPPCITTYPIQRRLGMKLFDKRVLFDDEIENLLWREHEAP